MNEREGRHAHHDGSAPSAARKTAGSAEATFDLVDLFQFVDRNWLLILVPGVLLAAAAWVVFVLVSAPTYEAAATLVVLPPKFSSRLKPEPLTVQGYQRLLESDAVVAETTRQLVEEDLVGEGEALRVGDEIRSRIFVSRRAEETTLAPIIEALAKAGSPEEAALTANTWAAVFLDHTRNLRVAGLDPTIELIESQYAAEREKVEELSSERNVTAKRYDEAIDEAELTWSRRVDETRSRWNRRLAEHQQETEDLVAAFQVETRRIVEKTLAERLPGLAPPEVVGGDGLRSAGEQIRRVATLHVQVAQTPQFLVINKAITDDALWTAEAILQGMDRELKTVLGKQLITEEVNPVHAEVTSRLQRAEAELEDLLGEPDDAVRDLLITLEAQGRQRSADLDRLLTDRTLGIAELRQQRIRELDALDRERDRKVAELTRRRDDEMSAVERDLEVEVELVQQMARENQQAALARSERDVADVRLGSRAVPPLKPAARHGLPRILAGLFLGLFAGAVLAFGREVQRGGAQGSG